jgi:hypothetical protein
MKKLLIASNVLLLCIIGLQAFNQKETGSNIKTSSPSQTCLAKICSGYSNSQNDLRGLINYASAIEMSRDYASDVGKKYVWYDSKISKKDDASSLVFDLLTLKKYIWYIESNVCDRGCDDSKLQLGIRFYYAKYPDANTMRQDYYLKNVDTSFANRHTLFMVPVYRYLFTKGIYKNFWPEFLDHKCQFKWPNNPPPDSIRIQMSVDESEQNHGSLRPPPAGSGVFPEN